MQRGLEEVEEARQAHAGMFGAPSGTAGERAVVTAWLACSARAHNPPHPASPSSHPPAPGGQGVVPPGQAVCAALLNHCHRMAHELEADLLLQLEDRAGAGGGVEE